MRFIKVMKWSIKRDLLHLKAEESDKNQWVLLNYTDIEWAP